MKKSMREMQYERKPRYYFAYGSNLHIEQMAARCPRAVRVVAGKLNDWRLTFRRVADIVPHKGQEVHGAIWRLSPDCEDALDKYEGFPHLYIKKMIHVEIEDGKYVEAMVYVMKGNVRDEARPGSAYYNTIKQGFVSWNLPVDALEAAKDAVHLSAYERY
jgi:gamma-glutamylcyclotransferase (GGCT)/AIG2-like uncharacterized protein YtfP